MLSTSAGNEILELVGKMHTDGTTIVDISIPSDKLLP